jgi:protein-tyrosine phosphatase
MVCMGNICRSPAGEAVLRSMIESRGLVGRFEVESAGTESYHIGSPPDPRTIRALKKRGYDCQHRARQVQGTDRQRFDHLVVMDDINLRDLKRRLGPGSNSDKGRITRLMDWWEGAPRKDVPDPYYGDEQDFELMMDLIEKGCSAMLDRLVSPRPDSMPPAL